MVQSGAYIALDTKSPDPNEKLFNVKGTPQQIQVAQQLITAKIEVSGSYKGFYTIFNQCISNILNESSPG